MATTSCWLLVFVWVVCWLPLMLAGHEEQQQGDGCSAKRCGNLTVSGPFWLADKKAGRSCGPFDFVVDCWEDSIPILKSSGFFGFGIMDISYEERNLHVVDVKKENDFNVSNGCHFPLWNTSGKLAPPFKVSNSNLNLIFYNCTRTMVHRDRALMKMRCVDATNAYARAGVRYDESGEYGGYALEGCNATVVPVMGSTSKVNASHYKQLINGGFLLTWDHPKPLPAPLPVPTPAPAHSGTDVVLETDAAPEIDYTPDDPSFAAELPEDGAPEPATPDTVDDYYYHPEGGYYYELADDLE